MSFYYTKAIKSTLINQMFHEVQKVASYTSLVNDHNYSSSKRSFPITNVPTANKYVKVLTGKYRNSVGIMTDIVGKNVTASGVFSLRLKFKDDQVGTFDYHSVELHAPPASYSNKTVFVSQSVSLPQVVAINNFGQEVKKGVYGLTFSRTVQAIVYAKITSVVKISETELTLIEYQTVDRHLRKISNPDGIYIFKDQEKAEKTFALEVLKC